MKCIIEISRKNDLFEAVSFVLAARLKQPAKLYDMSNAKIECKQGNIRIVAMDGRRLHLVDINECELTKSMDRPEDGLYQVLIANNKEIKLSLVEPKNAGRFPEYQDVIPTDWKAELSCFKCLDPEHAAGIVLYGLAQHNVYVKYKYLADAIKYLDNPTVSIIASDRPVLLTQRTRYIKQAAALIMPYLIPDYSFCPVVPAEETKTPTEAA